MNRKFFVSLVVLLFTVFSFSICLATDGSGIGSAVNDIRNFVGGVEDTVEDAARDVSNTSKSVTGGTENMMNSNRTSGMTSSNMNTGYSATRTNTDATMSMSQNTWICLILGIAAIAIIAVVWYYSMQFTNTSRHGRNDDDNEN